MNKMSVYPTESVILAPLSGHTDLPWRRSARRHGCRFAFTEMIDAGSLVFGNLKTIRFLDSDGTEDWLGAQLVGVDPDMLRKATEICNTRELAVIDFNLGCPTPKLVKKDKGAALAEKPEMALRAFEAIKSVSKFPVTAKIRILDENDPEPTLNLAGELESAGAEALAIHGRIRSKFYSGPVFTDIIQEVRKALKIPVIANGGIMDFATYNDLREATGCDVVMVARGAMGNPWIFREIAEGEKFHAPTVTEFADELETHINEMVVYYGEELGMKVARKVILEYLRGRGFTGKLKSKVSFLKTRGDFKKFMTEIRKGPSLRYWSTRKNLPDTSRSLRPMQALD